MVELKHYRFWVQSVLPLVYDDSLSYYEVLAKCVNYINNLIDNDNEMLASMEDMQAAIVEIRQMIEDAGIVDINELEERVTTLEDKTENLPNYETDSPVMDGTASAGISTKYSRGDHVHPSDTSRAPNNHAITGTTYGTGNSTKYGHVKLSDSYGDTDATNGTAATPKAVNELAKEVIKDNLIVNGYFVGGGSQLGSGIFPINQRGAVNGQASYTPSNNAYFIDRWRSGTYQLTATLQSDGILLAAGDANAFMLQPIPFEYVAGKVVTYSALYNDGTTDLIASASGTIPNSNASSGSRCSLNAQIPNGNYCVIDWASNGPLQVKFGITAGNSIKLKALKLEIGNKSTLANLINGTWVINNIPDWTIERAKCQRFLLELNSDKYKFCSFGFGMTDRTSRALVFFNTPVGMARLPDIQYSGGIEMLVGSTSITITDPGDGSKAINIGSGSFSSRGVYCTVAGTDLTVGDVVLLRSSGTENSGASILLIAE